jgi:hypothetical protein
MASRRPPIAAFTADDLATLRSIFPLGRRHCGPVADVFAVPDHGRGTPWLLVSRQQDGSYVRIDPVNGTRIARQALAELSLE